MKAPYCNIARGTTLVASPDIDSGLFFRSVILLCEHNMSGSFGLILNKPISFELPQEILDIHNLPNPNVRIQAGGPLQTNQMMLLHSSDANPKETLNICEGTYLGGDVQFLQEAASRSDGPHLRLCFGYTAWGPGQLEHDFLEGAWFLAQGCSRYVFAVEPEKLWQVVLRDMGGKYAALSMIPEDLSLN